MKLVILRKVLIVQSQFFVWHLDMLANVHFYNYIIVLPSVIKLVLNKRIPEFLSLPEADFTLKWVISIMVGNSITYKHYYCIIE